MAVATPGPRHPKQKTKWELSHKSDRHLEHVTISGQVLVWLLVGRYMPRTKKSRSAFFLWPQEYQTEGRDLASEGWQSRRIQHILHESSASASGPLLACHPQIQYSQTGPAWTMLTCCNEHGTLTCTCICHIRQTRPFSGLLPDEDGLLTTT